MLIKLHEIPDHGQDFNFDNKEGTLNESLKDLIQNNPYTIKITVNPAGAAFDARGSVHVQLPEQCSFCAKDFNETLKMPFHEILIVGDKTKCSIESGSISPEEDISVTNLSSHLFDVGEFFHEMIGLSQSNQPKCSADCKGLCLSCGHDLNEGPCGCKVQENPKESAFSILKNLKLN